MPFPTARKGLLAAGVAASLTLLTACGAAETTPTTEPGAPITSTTRIASAGVLGNHRKPDESCAPEPAPARSPDAPRRVSLQDEVSRLPVPAHVDGVGLPARARRQTNEIHDLDHGLGDAAEDLAQSRAQLEVRHRPGDRPRPDRGTR